eukprot:m.450521 g.450521  ORF g.450521 m.450521 type:complete len:84 (-) comp20014_c1_seq1:379-630(-)
MTIYSIRRQTPILYHEPLHQSDMKRSEGHGFWEQLFLGKAELEWGLSPGPLPTAYMPVSGTPTRPSICQVGHCWERRVIRDVG